MESDSRASIELAITKAMLETANMARAAAFKEVADLLDEPCPHFRHGYVAKLQCEECMYPIQEALEQGHLPEERP